jgi:hypothetical protein
MMGRSELCAWLRANSSGIDWPAAEAADEIEHLAEAKDSHFAQAMANGAKAREYRDEADALRKDAERYRFLCGDFSPMGLNIDGNHAWAYRRNATLKGPSLDAAIDAAMAAR